jgi:hypothetical protein
VLGHSFGSVLLWDILCHQPSRGMAAPHEAEVSGSAEDLLAHAAADAKAGEAGGRRRGTFAG